MAERFGFSTATIDRARQVLRRGTESEIGAVLEGKRGLKVAYQLILRREREETERLREDVAPRKDGPGEEPEELELDESVPELLARLRDLTHELIGRCERALDVLDSEPAVALREVQAGALKLPLEQAAGFIDDIREAASEL